MKMSYKKNQSKFQSFISHYQLFIKVITKYFVFPPFQFSTMKQNLSRFCMKVQENTLRHTKSLQKNYSKKMLSQVSCTPESKHSLY